VQAGLGGYARRGHWAPIRVTVGNVREPIEGLLELEQDQTTATPVTLVPGGTKRYTLYFLIQTVNEFAPQFTLEVRLRQGRRVLAAQTARLQLVDPGSRLLLTATGDSTGLQALHGVALGDLGWKVPEAGSEGADRRESDRVASPGLPTAGAPIAEGVAHVAHHTPGELPDRWNGYQAADLLVLTGAAWSALGPPQRQAVRRWIESGGRAILCGDQPRDWSGPDARQLIVDGGLRIADLGKEELISNGQPRDAGSTAIRDAPSTVSRAGFGIVEWVGFDPFRSTVRLAPGYRRLWRKLIARASGTRSERAALSDLLDVPGATRGAAELPRVPAPSRAVLVAIAVAYALIFGPVNIRILRRLRRTVKAWLFLPSLAVLMTVVLVTMGQSWGRSHALMNRVTVTEAMSGAATGWENNLMGLFSPTNLALNVEIGDPSVALRPEESDTQRRDPGTGAGLPPTYPSGYPGAAADTRAPNTALNPVLQLEDRSRWERLPLTLWSVQYQTFRRPIDLDGSVSLALRERVRDRPAGEVRNGTSHALTHAYLQYHGRRFVLGTLPPGASRPIGPDGWVRRLAARASGGVAPGSSRSEAFAELYGDAPVLLRAGSRGHEAVLVAETPDLRVPVTVEGVPERRRAGLLLVRAPVGR
jgi:hypothetical protein